MMEIILSFLAMIIAITLLVGIHEFGHFWVARCLGIKVLRFVIGFGKSIWRWRDKRGTEYGVAIIPLGGYVKLLDEREGAVLPEELSLAFNRQPLWKRSFVVLAGPLFNIILSVMAFWLIFSMGMTSVIPVIGQVMPNSIAQQAGVKTGQEIVAIDNQPTSSWQKVAMAVAQRLGDTDYLELQTRDVSTQSLQTYRLDLHRWNTSALQPSPLESLGIVEYIPPAPPLVQRVIPQKAAENAGIRSGDRIVSINQQPVENWQSFIAYIRHHPNQTVLIGVERHGKLLQLSVTIDARGGWFSGVKTGYIGVEFAATDWPSHLLRERQYSLFEAVPVSISEVWSLLIFHLIVLKKMLVGAISIKSLGGPLSLFKGAVVAAEVGIVPYLSFLGTISLGLAVINLLPIPGLDGGHLLYFIVEAVLRRPIPNAVQVLILRLGIILLVILMVQAIMNDLLRL